MEIQWASLPGFSQADSDHYVRERGGGAYVLDSWYYSNSASHYFQLARHLLWRFYLLQCVIASDDLPRKDHSAEFRHLCLVSIIPLPFFRWRFAVAVAYLFAIYGCNGTEFSYVILTEQRNFTTAERRNSNGRTARNSGNQALVQRQVFHK